MAVVTHNLTERELAEEAMRDSEAKYRLLFDSMLNGFAHCQMLFDNHCRPVDFVYLNVNDSFARLTGLHDVVGKRVTELIPGIKESNPELLEIYGRVASTGQPETFETYVEPLHIWFSIAVHSPRRDHFVAIFDNITERKRAEEALRRTKQRLESALGNSPLAVIEWSSEEFRIERWSDEATRVFGWTCEETIGKRLDELDWVYEEDWPLVRDVMADMLSGKRPRNVNKNRNVRKDGTVIHCEWYNSTVTDSSGKLEAVLSLVLDVTDRKRAEDELRAARLSAETARAAAEQATQAKDKFLAVLSHELRTPLTPVLAAAQLMARKPNLNEDMRHGLEIITRNVQLQARLIDDLLDLTRIVQGKLELDRKLLDISTVIERAVEISKPDIDARRLHFAVEIKDGPHRVYGDPSRLQQVIWNLMSNAVKFTADGGCVGVRCWREDGQAVIEVRDNGMGIPPERIERIFDAFEQGGRGITRRFGGLGLGLAIAKRLVEMHEGTISAYSDGANGSTFRISLPLVFTEIAAESGEHSAIACGESKRVLLVEDNADAAETIKLLLEMSGYEVDTASGVAQALKAIAAQDFDLLISDLGLPDQSGIELMHELRRRGNALKGIALSGYGQEEDARRSREAGFSAHLTKPADADVLLKVVAGTIGADN